MTLARSEALSAQKRGVERGPGKGRALQAEVTTGPRRRAGRGEGISFFPRLRVFPVVQGLICKFLPGWQLHRCLRAQLRGTAPLRGQGGRAGRASGCTSPASPRAARPSSGGAGRGLGASGDGAVPGGGRRTSPWPGQPARALVSTALPAPRSARPLRR